MADTGPKKSLLVGMLSPQNPKVSRSQQLNKLYALPTPLRTFPLPNLIPHNPLSLFHILYVWLSQTISPPSSHFEPLYQGTWSPDTRSVHVTDSRSIRGLWEQGFFGKGTLSRSEPNWMKGQIARANKSRATSEEITKKRREERQQAKWERARKEREAIDQKLLEEAGAALENPVTSEENSSSTREQAPQGSIVDSPIISEAPSRTWVKTLNYFLSPTGPIELLSLPNSVADLEKWTYYNGASKLVNILETVPINRISTSPEASSSPDEQNSLKTSRLSASEDLLLEPNGIALNDSHIANGIPTNGYTGVAKPHPNALDIDMYDGKVNGLMQSEDIAPASFNTTPNGSALANEYSRSLARSGSRSQKSVRFSPTVEKNTFIQTEPPSPDQSVGPATSSSTNIEIKEEQTIQEQEFFQLMMEEAFFLSYSLGALSIFDSTNNSPIPNQDLFSLFRKSSHFPPLSNPVLAPDDSFLLNYVVYHHYRSLGWCVRGGAKFSCDFMLYNRGPVFSHAEFAILIIPSYTDPYWSSDPFVQNYVSGKEKRNWSWMHCMNRVISQVKKKLILVYVDVPSPMDAEAEKGLRIDQVLGRYKIREFVMRRWLSNRERK